jgi:hypothetical protein
MAQREHGSETAIQKQKREKRICIETLRNFFLLLMTVSVQIYENRKRVNKSEFQRKFKQFLTYIFFVRHRQNLRIFSYVNGF